MSTTTLKSALGTVESSSFPPTVKGRIPSLDGLRAAAILMVIIDHLRGAAFNVAGVAMGRLPMHMGGGSIGVRIFFVISGFLITSLLLKEQQVSGAVSLAGFYFRRALRILPASYFFLAVMAIISALGIVMIPAKSFCSSALYFRNYLSGGDWYTSHLWSLSVEEQFYLLWPFIFCILRTRGALIAAIATLPMSDIFRLVEGRPINFSSEANMDALACGCILAMLWGFLGRNRAWQRFLKSPFFWIAPICAIASGKLVLAPLAWFAVGTGIGNVFIAISIERFVRYHQFPSSKLLNTSAFLVVGTLSYSLYLWQMPFVVMMQGGHGHLQTFPLNVVLACVCAVLSYTLIERPFLRLRNRLRTKVSFA